MTIKEAIKYWEEFLKEIPEIVKEGLPQDEAEEQEQATIMAIEALKESKRGKCEECIVNTLYKVGCKKECGEHEFCRGGDVRR